MKAEIFNYSCWVANTDKEYLEHVLGQMLKESGLTVLSYQEHSFKPYGYTGLWLIAESHFAVHTFPEENKAYIELSSCNEEKQDKFVKLLLEKLHVVSQHG